ncbi:Echinoderm microtubule-associated protein-like 1 [Trichinella pseudospiralis]|uniref:Echinoderm microtubule-associated protein-like 1 n=1 Tax=Trichinella pseudospiralis TaxID=6337 RepID=A0A0V1F8R1_TRIPS|nr:Echinoderm microtubule-associated protein-like 1 [Trichinella pseudospiralis]
MDKATRSVENLSKWSSDLASPLCASTRSLYSSSPKQTPSTIGKQTTYGRYILLLWLGKLTPPLLVLQIPILKIDFFFASTKTTLRLQEGRVYFTYKRTRRFYEIPTNLDDEQFYNQTQAPTETANLEWVYAYQSNQCKNNLHFLPTNELLYAVESVIILSDFEKHTQRYYTDHTERIKCIAVRPEHLLVASSQYRKTNEIRIWEAITLHTHAMLNVDSIHAGAVTLIALSKLDAGQYLVTVEEQPHQRFAVWKWKERRLLAESRHDHSTIVGCEFHPCIGKLFFLHSDVKLTLATIHGDRLREIYLQEDHPMTSCTRRFIGATFADNGDLLTGDLDSAITVWDARNGRQKYKFKTAHSGGVTLMLVNQCGMLFTVGGRDQKLIEWTSNLQKVCKTAQISDQHCKIKSITFGSGEEIFLATEDGRVLRGTTLDGKFEEVIPAGESASPRCLAIHPLLLRFISCNRDGRLTIWDGASKSLISYVDLNKHCQTLAWQNSGQAIAVGCKDGSWLILDSSLANVTTTCCGVLKTSITCLEFSKSDNKLAVGDANGTLYIYQLQSGHTDYTLLGKTKPLKCAIQYIDWSDNEQFLRTQTENAEIFFYNASNGLEEITTQTMLHNAVWKTENCFANFNTLGAMSKLPESNNKTLMTISHKKKLLAIIDESSTLKLFNYPCISENALYTTTSVRMLNAEMLLFTNDDSRIITTGSNIFQWSIE